MAMLKRIESPACPFTPQPQVVGAKGRQHWVKPLVVAQIRYTEITDDGRLRHPAYLGLRDDKLPAEVTVPTVPQVPKGSKGTVRTSSKGSGEKVTQAAIESPIDQLNFLEKARKNGRL